MYSIPLKTHVVEIEVKKSRFIAHAMYAIDRNAAMNCLAEIKQTYPDARHHCWAYLLGDPLNAASMAMSDDGEPSGTAGKPILNVLQHKGVGDVVLVVTRYFGGIKLGAGGLVRAYSAAAQAVMEALPIEERIATASQTVELTFAQEQLLRHWLDCHSGHVGNVDYATANVIMIIELPVSELDEFNRFCAAQSISQLAAD